MCVAYLDKEQLSTLNLCPVDVLGHASKLLHRVLDKSVVAVLLSVTQVDLHKVEHVRLKNVVLFGPCLQDSLPLILSLSYLDHLTPYLSLSLPLLSLPTINFDILLSLIHSISTILLLQWRLFVFRWYSTCATQRGKNEERMK